MLLHIHVLHILCPIKLETRQFCPCFSWQEHLLYQSVCVSVRGPGYLRRGRSQVFAGRRLVSLLAYTPISHYTVCYIFSNWSYACTLAWLRLRHNIGHQREGSLGECTRNTLNFLQCLANFIVTSTPACSDTVYGGAFHVKVTPEIKSP